MRRSTRSLAVVIATLLSSSSTIAQAPWNRAPALPSGCYTTGESFIEDVAREIDALSADVIKQREVNAAVKAKVGELDAGTKQARMMAFLQTDPIAGAKAMQDMSSASARGEPAVAAMRARREELDAQLADLHKRHDTQLAAAAGELVKQMNGELEPGGNPAKARTLGAQVNAVYQKHCAQWWGDASPYRAYLRDLKDFHDQHAIPVGEEGARIEKAALDLYGIPHGGLKSVEPLRAVHDYLEDVSKIFQRRWREPAKT